MTEESYFESLQIKINEAESTLAKIQEAISVETKRYNEVRSERERLLLNLDKFEDIEIGNTHEAIKKEKERFDEILKENEEFIASMQKKEKELISLAHSLKEREEEIDKEKRKIAKSGYSITIGLDKLNEQLSKVQTLSSILKDNKEISEINRKRTERLMQDISEKAKVLDEAYNEKEKIFEKREKVITEKLQFIFLKDAMQKEEEKWIEKQKARIKEEWDSLKKAKKYLTEKYETNSR